MQLDPADMIPIFGMFTGILTTGLFFWGVVKVAQSSIGEALARRILGRHGQADADVVAGLQALQEQVDALHQQLGETQDRLDFAERLLAQGRQAEQLPGR